MTTALRFELPELAGPFPVMTHPEYKWIERESSAWTQRQLGFAFPDQQAFEQFVAFLHPLWVCLCYPTATDRRRLANICNLHQCMFLTDDIYVELTTDHASAHDLLHRFEAILSGGDPSSPLETAIAAAYQLLAADMPTAQRDRLATDLITCWTGAIQEYKSRAHDQVTSLDQHLVLRRRSTGAYFCLTLMEYGLGIDLTRQLRDDPDLTQIRDLLADQVGLVNDVLSYRKEYFTGDNVNAVRVLENVERLSLQEAVNRVAALIDDKGAQLLALKDRILAGTSGADSSVNAYLDGMLHMIGGNTRWHFYTPRYNGTDHVWNGITSGIVTWYPDHTVYGPEGAR